MPVDQYCNTCFYLESYKNLIFSPYLFGEYKTLKIKNNTLGNQEINTKN